MCLSPKASRAASWLCARQRSRRPSTEWDRARAQGLPVVECQELPRLAASTGRGYVGAALAVPLSHGPPDRGRNVAPLPAPLGLRCRRLLRSGARAPAEFPRADLSQQDFDRPSQDLSDVAVRKTGKRSCHDATSAGTSGVRSHGILAATFGAPSKRPTPGFSRTSALRAPCRRISRQRALSAA
jgi:hypothetical protein